MARLGRCAAIALVLLVIANTLILQTDSASCCLSYTRRRIRCRSLKAFSVQETTTTCDIKAIVFHMTTGRFICANPAQRMTQRIIKCLKRRAETESIGGIPALLG